MMFTLPWRNWRWLWHVYARCVLQGIIKILFKRDWRFWYHFVTNLLGYTCAKNYQKRSWFDKVIAKIKWCSFFWTHSVVYHVLLLQPSGSIVWHWWNLGAKKEQHMMQCPRVCVTQFQLFSQSWQTADVSPNGILYMLLHVLCVHWRHICTTGCST